MLDILRKRKRSWVSVFFVGIIALVFALFYGGGSNLNQQRRENVATVNGEAISQRELELQYERRRRYYQNIFGGNLTQETLRNLNLRSTIVEELIQRRLLSQEAQRLGLEATDEEMMDSISRIPEFQINGRFSKDRYLRVLRSNRILPVQFEIEQKEELTIRKLNDIIRDSIRVSETEVRDQYRLEQERVNFYFIRLSANDFVTSIEVTDEEINADYELNKNALREPLKVQVEYLEYPFSYYSSKIKVSEKEIEEFYNLHKETQFHQSKAVRVRHILFRVPEGTDLKQREAIRLKAEGVLKKAKAGEDFAKLAKEHSDDPSAAQGGEIGFFSQGEMLPQLDKAAFALKKGEISDLLESTIGYHLLKLKDVREEKTTSLKDATKKIVRAIKAERGRDEAAKAVDKDREDAISGANFSQLAEGKATPLKVSPFFARSDAIPGVGRVEKFNEAAFSLGVNGISPAIEGNQAHYLIKVKQRKAPFVPPLDQVRPALEKRLKEEKAFELAARRADSLLRELNEEKDIKQLSNRHGLLVEETGWFMRKDSTIPKVGNLEGVRFGGIPISRERPIPEQIYAKGNALYLIAFKESQGADMERFEKEKGRLQEETLRKRRQRVLNKFVQSLKVKAKIDIQPEFLEES